MDSRLIAGAYSQHYRALEQDQSERSDSIARAKKLSQETNKRRKIQAQKRKLEAKKEEQRRQEILTKRREEQKQATEKYQRSHVPNGSRQNSGRLSPQRYAPPCLEDALQLIRRSPRRERPGSGRENVSSPKNENDDPLKRSYFNKSHHHSARPSSGRSSHQLNHEARAELMDYSLKNLTSSKSLFEQQLEQQQSLLLQKQQQSLREFSKAVQEELYSGIEVENQDKQDEVEETEMALSDSCSSLDSLERSDRKDEKDVSQAEGNHIQDKSQMNHQTYNQEQSFYLNPQNGNNLNGQTNLPLNQDMTPSAIFKNNFIQSEQGFQGNNNEEENRILTSMGYNGMTKLELLDQNFQNNVKKGSGDSLEESESSSSSISLIRIPETNDQRNKFIDGKAASDHFKSVKSNFVSQVNDTKPPNAHLVDTHKAKTELNDKRENLRKEQHEPMSELSYKHVIGRQQSNEQGANDKAVIPTTAVRNEPVIESYNPRYASAIGLSIWPGHSQANSSSTLTGTSASNNLSNNASPYGKRTSTVSLVSGLPNSTQQKSPVKNLIPPQIQLENHNKTENKSTPQGANIVSTLSVTSAVMNTKPFVPDADNALHTLKKQDFVYPLPQNITPQNHTLLPSHENTYNTLQQEIKQLSDQLLENNIVNASQSPHLVPNSQYTTTTTTTTPSLSSPMQQPDKFQVIHHIPHGNDFVTGPVPVPAVRTVFPTNKPPVPNTVSAQQSQPNTNQVKTPTGFEDTSKTSKNLKNEATPDERGCNDEGVKEETENTKSLKGILKHLPPKVPAPGQQKGAIQVRDSLELAKMQNDKKVKKKSVRFAAFVEENEDEYSAEDLTASNAIGISNLKQQLNRPTSAKVSSQPSSLVVTSKPVRSASAGSARQPMSVIQHSHNSNGSVQNNIKGSHVQSNLPPQFSLPFNTAAPINRPKAAAHIIMSSESHHPVHKDGDGPTNSAASSLHKSQLEMKVKAVNNNFMSKVPVKVNTNNNAVVFQVATATAMTNAANENSQQRDTQIHQGTERSRIRDNTSSKKLPLSNSTITRTSIVPASTKINYPVSSGVAPSYSTNNNNAQNSTVTAFDESKVRVDKTPTDEEIAWLWDKVRNCLDKDGEKVESKPTGSSGIEQPRQTPVLSTKIIDGNSLGFNTNGAAPLRPGSGYLYTRNGGGAVINGQNKIKPAVQQQGSYLRRYGLLQQRRVNSASGTPSNPAAIQARAGSAGLMRYPAMQVQQQQQQQIEGPKPIALSYKAQDNVSESTAAFVMAERLAKQSLTDSHIAMGMEDAQSKQEVHNRSRMVQTGSGGGPSALSIEEQRLMESLDKLNERLKVSGTEQKSYSGTIHYHQPYQPHRYS